MTTIDVLTVDGSNPVDRGRQLARGAGPGFRDGLATYEALFAWAGLSTAQVKRVAGCTRDALADWAPDLAGEIDAYADTLCVDRWRLHALNARTETLALGHPMSARECSTIVQTAPRVIGAQTWDWHTELSQAWHVVHHRDVDLPFTTLTERGMVGKIGMNAAGVGLLFNILGHPSDASGQGVPVHAVARRVLDTARDVEHAIEIVRGAPLQASSCLTVLGPDSAACLEATPSGVALIEGHGDWLVHTNHFLDPGLATADVRVVPEPDTLARASLLTDRVRARSRPASRDSLVETLCAHEDPDGAAVCCHPAETDGLGTAWQTLATVVLDPAAPAMLLTRGGPCTIDTDGWRGLTPDSTTVTAGFARGLLRD